MIDITIGNNEVSVENKLYHSFNEKDNLALMIKDIIDQAKYSGESITLWIDQGDTKRLIEDWGSERF